MGDSSLFFCSDTTQAKTRACKFSDIQKRLPFKPFDSLTTSGIFRAGGLATFSAGATVSSGQTFTVTGATIAGFTAASVSTGTFPSGAYNFTGATTLTGGAGNMTVVAGTGNSRTLTFQTTTSGGTATTALTLNADQSATFAGTVAIGQTSVTNSQVDVLKNHNYAIRAWDGTNTGSEGGFLTSTAFSKGFQIGHNVRYTGSAWVVNDNTSGSGTINMSSDGSTSFTGQASGSGAAPTLFQILTTGVTVPSGQILTLTGVTVAGTPTWSSNQAITLSTAAQPNVTSLGTLTSLATSGTATLRAIKTDGPYAITAVNATATTIVDLTALAGAFSATNNQANAWLVVGASTDGNVLGGCAIVQSFGNVFQVTAWGTPTSITYSISGNNLRVTQSTGADRPLEFTFTRLIR